MREKWWQGLLGDGKLKVSRAWALLIRLLLQSTGLGCVSQMQQCQNSYCTGVDESKCASEYCMKCQTAADKCAARASPCNGCGDYKCDKDAGETMDTCCPDCGCFKEGERYCEENAFGEYECQSEMDEGDWLCHRLLFPALLMPLLSFLSLLVFKA